MQYRGVKSLKISLPEDLINELNLKFYDPITARPKYGGRSALIERLIRDYLDSERKRRMEFDPNMEREDIDVVTSAGASD